MIAHRQQIIATLESWWDNTRFRCTESTLIENPRSQSSLASSRTSDMSNSYRRPRLCPAIATGRFASSSERGRTESCQGERHPGRGPGYWDGKIPWITPGELTNFDGKYLSETRESLSSQGLAASGSSTLLPQHSLLVTMRASLGSVALTAHPMSTNQGFKSVVSDHPVILRSIFTSFRYFYQSLCVDPPGQHSLRSPQNKFAQIVIPVPPSGTTEDRRGLGRSGRGYPLDGAAHRQTWVRAKQGLLHTS